MKKNKIITLSVVAGLTCAIVCGAYIFAIQGEKIEDGKHTWITETPIAHRGFDNGDVIENSMESFKLAIEKGYAIELDVQLTKDKVPVIFHDSNLERLTGDNRYVRDVEYSELKTLKLNGTEETIPTLKEVLDLVNNQVPIAVEIKDGKGVKELAALTYEVLKDYDGEYMIQSFNPYILGWFKENDSEVIRCQLSCNFEGEQNSHLKWYEKFVLKNLLMNFVSRPHVVAYDIEKVDNLSTKLWKAKHPLITWTIEDEEDMNLGYEKSDNIIFDNIEP